MAVLRPGFLLVARNGDLALHCSHSLRIPDLDTNRVTGHEGAVPITHISRHLNAIVLPGADGNRTLIVSKTRTPLLGIIDNSKVLRCPREWNALRKIAEAGAHNYDRGMDLSDELVAAGGGTLGDYIGNRDRRFGKDTARLALSRLSYRKRVTRTGPDQRNGRLGQTGRQGIIDYWHVVPDQLHAGLSIE